MAFISRRLVLATCLLAGRTALAASPDPRTLRDQLEERVLDGDRDAEDLAALGYVHRAAPRHHGGEAYVALEAFAAEGRASHVYGALLVLQLPIDGFVSRASLPPPDRRTDHLVVVTEAPPVQKGLPVVRGLIEPIRAAPTPERPRVAISTEVARACVRAALRAMGIGDDGRVDSLASRARSSAALPELRLRAMRTIDESGRLSLTDSDPTRYVEAGGSTSFVEARLTFRLDRLLFADDEVAIERLRNERSELRTRTIAKVLTTLFEWQRAAALVQDPSLSSDEHFSAVLRELEASAVLDVMTDGWFGRFRATGEH